MNRRDAVCGFITAVLLSAAPIAVGQTIAGEPDRVRWQRLTDLLAAMAVHEGDSVADVGAGDGFVTVRLSPVVGPAGKVYAEDIADAPLQRLRKRVEDAGLVNVTIVKGEADDPHLPHEMLDAVIILNAYHEMTAHESVLAHVRDALKAGGRLVVAEPGPLKAGQTRTEQIRDHRISGELVAADVSQAAFDVVDRQDDFAPLPGGVSGTYSLIVARKR